MKLSDFGLLTDENVHSEIGAFLRQRSFDVRTAREANLQGASDTMVMRTAFADNRVIITHDGDFGRLAIAAGEPFVGIVFLRPGHIAPVFSIRVLEQLLVANVEVTVPFVIAVRRHGNRVRIRVRRWN